MLALHNALLLQREDISTLSKAKSDLEKKLEDEINKRDLRDKDIQQKYKKLSSKVDEYKKMTEWNQECKRRSNGFEIYSDDFATRTQVPLKRQVISF